MNNGNRYLNLPISILLGMVLCLPVISAAQPATFDNMYDFNNWWDGGVVSIVTSQGYLSVGATRNLSVSDSTANQSLILLKSDNQGNQQWTKILMGIDSVNLGINESLYQLPSGQYIASGFMVDFRLTGNPAKAVLLKFDSIGQISWFKTYDAKGFAGVEYLLPLNDGSFIFCGQSADTATGDEDMFLAYADSAGNLLWWEEYPSPGRDIALSVIPNPKGYLVSGFRTRTSNNQAYSYILQTNSLGQPVQGYTYQMGPFAHAGQLFPASNGQYYYIGNADLNAAGDHFAGFVLKLDSNLDSLWSASWQRDDRLYFDNLLERPNGDLILSGGSLNEQGLDGKAWLGRVSNTGTLLWERTYIHDPGGRDYVSSLIATSDHGFLLTGTAQDSLLTSTTHQNIWLLKTDTFGCVQPGCHLTDSRGDDPVLSQQVWLKAGPNPFTDQTTLSYDLPSGLKGSFRLDIYDLSSGRLHQSYPVQPGQGQVRLRLDKPTSGLLVAALKQNDKTLTMVKLVRQQ